MLDPEDRQRRGDFPGPHLGKSRLERFGVVVVVDLALGPVGGGYHHDLLTHAGVAGEHPAGADDLIVGMGVKGKKAWHESGRY